MNSQTAKTTLAIFVIVAALALVTAVVATSSSISNSVFAAGGPKSEKNFGQCKKHFNENPCRHFHTG
jgi:hypothetical protein